LLPSIYDYAAVCNAINPVLYYGSSEKNVIAPRSPVSKGSEAYTWRVRIKDVHSLWGDSNFVNNP
jgi:hypothetical protein